MRSEQSNQSNSVRLVKQSCAGLLPVEWALLPVCRSRARVPGLGFMTAIRENATKKCFTAFLAAAIMFAVVWNSATSACFAENSNESFKRPWESRPYQVMVWICSNDSPEIVSTLPLVETGVMRRAELADPSAWNVAVETAPGQWRSRLLEFFMEGVVIERFAESDALSQFDKLIAVCLTNKDGAIRYQVREFDVLTGQWGALLDKICPESRHLGANVFNAIKRVFMPLARIDRVSADGEVFVRARAINACLQSDPIDLSVSANENSPVLVHPEDRFLPIIRKVDRNGDLAQLEPIPFTFLTVEDQAGPRLVCKIHSRQRSALGGRSSKRAQKLALVIRPPESSTLLKLVARDDVQHPLSGYEIFSRRPSAPTEEESEFLGLTDWRGIIEVPPFEGGLRLIYVKHGSRPLMKLPIIPGLYDQVVTRVPDDEARLNAEGIAQGFQIEILNLVAQRQLLQAQINSALKKQDVDSARSLFQQFQRIESPQNLKIRLANEETRLENSTLNKRELQHIERMFQQLLTLVNKNVNGSVESDLQSAIQKARSANANQP